MNCPIPAFLQDHNLSQEGWDTLLTLWRAHEKSLKKGGFLVQAGDKVAAIYIVTAGRLDLQFCDYWGNTSLLGQLGKGQLFGAAYVFGKEDAYAVSVQAAEDSTVLVIPSASLDATMHTHPDLAFPFLRGLLGALSNRSLQLIYTIEQIKQRTLRNKILAYLTHLARQQGSPRVQCPLGRQQMADYLAVDRASLSRELSALQKEGLLTYKKNIFVLNIN